MDVNGRSVNSYRGANARPDRIRGSSKEARSAVNGLELNSRPTAACRLAVRSPGDDGREELLITRFPTDLLRRRRLRARQRG